jgi:ketosteroid isomerase-like protein
MTHEALMRKVVGAFAVADLQPLFDALDENIVWKSASTVGGTFRFGGEYSKIIGVKEVMSQIATAYSFHRFEPKEFIESGDIIWGLFEVEASYQPTGEPSAPSRPLQFECAIRWRIRDNKIAEHQAFLDTSSLLHQQDGLPQPWAKET